MGCSKFFAGLRGSATLDALHNAGDIRGCILRCAIVFLGWQEPAAGAIAFLEVGFGNAGHVGKGDFFDLLA